MTDAELTALAAKAFCDAPVGFSPLTDDGDALRLLVMLTAHDMVIVTIGRNGCDLEFDSLVHDISERGDPFAATRRAIVRAAAEIGRKL